MGAYSAERSRLIASIRTRIVSSSSADGSRWSQPYAAQTAWSSAACAFRSQVGDASSRSVKFLDALASRMSRHFKGVAATRWNGDDPPDDNLGPLAVHGGSGGPSFLQCRRRHGVSVTSMSLITRTW